MCGVSEIRGVFSLEWCECSGLCFDGQMGEASDMM